MLDRTPTALQLRFLQTLVEVASEKNSTTLFPVPIDLISPFIRNMNQGGAGSSDGQRDATSSRRTTPPAEPADTPPESDEA